MALLVIIGAMADGTKEVLAVASGFRESAESGAGVLRGIRARGIGVPKLLVADGNLGIWAAARHVWSEAGEQRCWNHKMANVFDRLPKREQKQAKALLRVVVYAESGAAAEAARERFEDRYGGDYRRALDAPAHVGRQAGLGRDGPDLEAPHGGREAVPKAQRSPSAARRAPWRPLRGRPAGPGRGGAARGLTVVPQPRSGPGRRRSGRARPPAFA